MRKLLSKARDMLGRPVSATPQIVKAFERFMKEPTARTWDAIARYMVTPRTTVWQAVLNLDSTAVPKVGPTTRPGGRIVKDWTFVPHPFTVRRAIDEALRQQGLSGLGLAMTGSQRRRLRERITPGAFGGPGAFSSVEECCRRVLAQKRLGWQYADVARRIHLVRTWNACNSHPDKQLCQVAAACLSCLDQAYSRGGDVQGLADSYTRSPSRGKRLSDLLRLVKDGDVAAARTLADVCRWYGMDYRQTFEYVNSWTGISEARWADLMRSADEGFEGIHGGVEVKTQRPGSAYEPIVGGAVSLRVKEGTVVVYTPGVVFHATYRVDYPPPGTVGRVRRMNLGSRYSTFLPGPGGGLVYVYFDETGHHIGVPPQYLRMARGGRGFRSITDSGSDQPPGTATIIGVTALLAGAMIAIGAGITGAFSRRRGEEAEDE